MFSHWLTQGIFLIFQKENRHRSNWKMLTARAFWNNSGF
jgi:hypothetical protein